MERKINLTPQIINLFEKKLIGQKLKMSLAENSTAELWKTFMPHRSEIINKVSTDLISLQVYPDDYFNPFVFNRIFEKWASVEVNNFDFVPAGMETFVLKGGMYAMFPYKGSSSDGQIFQYIFGVWLPASEFRLDNRPHFEVLGSKYKNNDPDSEEEIWIPIKSR